MWFSVGQEILTDEGKHVACKAAKQGVKVQIEEWEGMPHCFCMVLMGTQPSQKSFKSWAEFARKAVKEPQMIETRGVRIGAKYWKETELEVEEVSIYTDDEVRCRMRYREARIDYEQGTDTLVG